MRKQTKYILKAALVVAGTTALVDLLLQHAEVTRKGLPWSWKNFDGKRLVGRSLLALGIGGLVGQGIYLLDAEKQSEKEFHPEAYLRKTLSDENIKSDSANFKKALRLRQEVKAWLNAKFADVLAGKIEDSGSFANRTAIRGAYDLDIIIPISKRSYNSLARMVGDLFAFTKKRFPNAVKIEKHKKGVLLKFGGQHGDVRLDLIPGRETRNYARDKTLTLYKSASYFWETDSSMKIVVPLQNKILVNRPREREIIKLLKSYRDRNNLPLPSVFIEQCVVAAMSRSRRRSQRSLSEDMLDCMIFIANKLDQKTVRDISNSNNNLNEKISDADRDMVATQLSDDVNRITRDPPYVKEIFET